jgi:hypothetical protein
MRQLAAVGMVTLTAGSAFAVWAPSAAAVSGIQTGYWSALPASPQVPAGGYEVGSNPSGAHAVAAIRFTLAAGETVQKLDLKIAQAQPASQVSVEACQVAAKSASWQPPSGGGPGPLTSAPTPDCGSGVAGGALSADGSSMTFDLSLMSFTGGVVDLLLQPSDVSTPVNSLPGAPGTTPASFDAAFDQLTAAQIEVTGGAAPSSGGGSTGSVAPVPPASQPVPQPPANQPSVSMPDTSTAQAPAAAPPVVAPQQPAVQQQPASTNAAAPLTTGKGRNWRLLFALSFLASDVFFVWLFVQHRQEAAAGGPGAGAGRRPKLSIYDPPPTPAGPAVG